MSIILRVEHADSPFGRDESTARIPSPTEIADRRLTSIRIEDILDGVSGAEVTLFRSDWVEILPHVSRTADAFTIEEDDNLVFGGRLDDFQFSGETVSLRLQSFETDALEARPVGNIEEGEEPFINPDPFPYLGEEDGIIVEELIDGTERDGLTGQVPGIDTLDTGTIETVEADARVRDSHQFPGVIMRDLTERTGAILRYNADQTVDYIERLGDDLDVTLTSDALVAPPRIRSSASNDFSGVFAFLPDETDNFEVQSWTAPTIDDPPPRDVFTRERAEGVVDGGVVGPKVDELLADIEQAREQLLVEARIDAQLTDMTFGLDDTVRVDFPEFEIRRERLRVVERVRRIGSEGETVELKLSNRRFTAPV